jgi:hypothetical protein
MRNKSDFLNTMDRKHFPKFTSKKCKDRQGFFFFFGCNSPQWARASSFIRFLYHTQWCTTVGGTPLDEWSARRRDLYLTTHNKHNRQDIHVPGGIRTHNLSIRAVADLCIRLRSHWEVMTCRNMKFCICIWSCLGKSHDFIITICHKLFLSLLVLS